MEEKHFEIKYDENGAYATDGTLILRTDFSGLSERIKTGNISRELIVKACRIKGTAPENVTVLDATAGLGQDSFILAAAGFNVIMYERDQSTAELLSSAMEKAYDNDELSDIVKRMKLIKADSTETMKELSDNGGAFVKKEHIAKPDVIFLDPMYPERKKSALVKKKFQLLHLINEPAAKEDEEKLLRTAFGVKPKKVVIKRPPKGEYLAGIKPDYSYTGKNVRFDCFTFA